MKEVEVKVDLNLRRLLNQEDLDRDLRITIEDRGPKLFLLEDLKGKYYEIAGSYPLSNLLQLLAYAHQERKKRN
jgi:alpha,alpha-trehalase